MLQSHLRASTLRGWVSRQDCPAVLRELKLLFDKSFGTTLDNHDNGSILVDGDEMDWEPDIIPDELSQIVGQHVKTHAHFRYQGVVYSRASTHRGNSLVQYYPNNKMASPAVPGSIQYIYSDKGGKVFFAIQRQSRLPSDIVDPFRLYPHIPASMWGSQLQQELEIVDPSWIFSHYARYTIDAQACVVLSLSQVGIEIIASSCCTDLNTSGEYQHNIISVPVDCINLLIALPSFYPISCFGSTLCTMSNHANMLIYHYQSVRHINKPST